MPLTWNRLPIITLLAMFAWPWLVELGLVGKGIAMFYAFGIGVTLSYFSFVFSIAKGVRFGTGIAPQQAVWLFLLSNALLIFMFAVGWKNFALFGPGGVCVDHPDLLDALYFSTTVFATVGFGDFVPCSGPGKLLLIVESLIGCTHFGIFITLVFSRVIQSGKAAQH